jgi:hypothetical protein
MMVQRILRCKCPLICCLRGEEKTHMTKPGEGAKGKVITDEFSTPLFDPRFIYEMLVNFETIARNGVGGFVIPRKITHPQIASILPGEDEQIGIKHGEAMARWCSAPAGTTSTTTDPLKALQAKLWALCKPFRGADKTWTAAEEKLRAWTILSEGRTVKDLTEAGLVEVIDKVTIQLTESQTN